MSATMAADLAAVLLALAVGVAFLTLIIAARTGKK